MINLPPPLVSLYIARRYAVVFLGVMLILLGLIYMFDLIELLRRSSKIPDLSLGEIATISLFKLPQVGQQIFPFAILISALVNFWQLAKSHELVVLRAAGFSAWQFLLPVVMAAAFIGIVNITLINPLGAVLLSHYEQWDNRMLRGQVTAVELSDSGLWLRQTTDHTQTIIHAKTLQPNSWILKNVLVLVFDKHDHFIERLDAPTARLDSDAWVFTNPMRSTPMGPELLDDGWRLPTELTPSKIEERFSSPETISFWALPDFMATLERTGLSTARLRMHYQSLLSQPLLYAGLILVAACFALRPTRQGYVLTLILAGVASGFALFFMRNLTIAFGSAGLIPTSLAAWASALIALIAGMAGLLYLEDG